MALSESHRSRFAGCALALVALAAGLAPLSTACAGVFSVAPLRLYMAPRDRAIAVALTNEGDTPVTLQADINNWSQTVDGVEELVPTEDLILSPPIIKLAPGARQVVRLALLKPADASRQLIYRMIVREVPEVTTVRDQAIQIPITLALSLPVFITPPLAKREVNCQAERRTPQALNVSCSNRGSAYAQVREMSLMRGEQAIARFAGGVYILPGARQTMTLGLDSGVQQSVGPGPAQLNVQFDDEKSQVFSITLP